MFTNCEKVFQLNVKTSAINRFSTVNTLTINSYQLFTSCEQVVQRFNLKVKLHIPTINNSQQINVTSTF